MADERANDKEASGKGRYLAVKEASVEGEGRDEGEAASEEEARKGGEVATCQRLYLHPHLLWLCVSVPRFSNIRGKEMKINKCQ